MAICLLTCLCGVPRDLNDLAALVQGLKQSPPPRPGDSPAKVGTYPAPSQPSLCRLGSI